METKTYDLVVVGGGPAGYAAGLRAAQEGAKVALVEMGALGGTCLNRGCIPTKCFYYSTKTYSRLKYGVLPEISFDNLALDYGKMLARKNSVVSNLREGLATLMKKVGIDVISGKAFVASKDSVEITKGKSNGQSIKAGMILIATGSSPGSLPFLPSDARIHNTDSIWDLENAPKNLLVIGGGVIGIEAANIYSAVSKRVTVVEILPEILVNVNKSYKRVVAKSLENRGVEILTGKKVVSVKPKDDCLEVIWEGDQNPKFFDAILVAVGRKPNISGIFDESLGILLKGGFIEVGEDLQTTVKGIYAAGDVIGNPMLAHAASREGIVAVNRGLGFDGKDKVDFDKIPEVIFSDPEIAQVGMIPDSAGKRIEGIKVGRFPYITSSKAMCEAETEGFAEIVFDEKNNKIVGGGIVGAHASDLIGEVLLAVNGELSPHAVEISVHPHPTFTEIIWEASADTIGKAIYKIRKK